MVKEPLSGKLAVILHVDIAGSTALVQQDEQLAQLYSEKGMIKEAKAQTKEILRIFPGASIEDEHARCFYRWTPDVLTRFFTGLRKSGMPEGRAGEEPISM